MSPARSKSQFKWLFTKDAEEKLGKKGAAEWIRKTKDVKKLPVKKS